MERIYLIEDITSHKSYLVQARSKQGALTAVLDQRFKVKVPDALDVAKLLTAGAPLVKDKHGKPPGARAK